MTAKDIKERICVLGAGSWGITLAVHMHNKGYPVSVWENFSEQAAKIDRTRVHPYLPGLQIPREILISSRLEESVRSCQVIVFAVPTHFMRAVARNVAQSGPSLDAVVVNAAKGIENDTLMRMSEVLGQELPTSLGKRVVTVSGPSHAEEVCRGIPTVVVAAGSDLELAKKVQELFMAPHLRIYTNTDIIGVELGGSLKNIYAIGAGICDGAGLGDNTKAALMTRGLVEMMRLGVAMGAKPNTFFGLSGMGDLFVTCMSRHSRNRLVGEKVGRGVPLQKAMSEMTMVAEGVRTAKSAHDLGRRYNVELPLAEQIYATLYENRPAKDAIRDLMGRMAKPEMEGLPF